MASFSEIRKPACHLRSISLPSKKHPLVTVVEEQLGRLRASGATPSMAGNNLGGLKDLYESVDDLLQFPLTQRTLAHQNCNTEEILGGSIRVLDVCGTTRDVFARMKECVQELESSLRRRRGDESSVENEVRAFMVSRRRLNKMVSRCIENSKRIEKNGRASSSDKDLDLTNVLRQVEETSLAVLESLLSHVTAPKTRSRPTGWSLVSKLTKSGKVSSDDQVDSNELEKIETELHALIGKKNS